MSEMIGYTPPDSQDQTGRPESEQLTDFGELYPRPPAGMPELLGSTVATVPPVEGESKDELIVGSPAWTEAKMREYEASALEGNKMRLQDLPHFELWIKGALELAEIQAKLKETEKKLRTDTLTGLGNRLALNEVAEAFNAQRAEWQLKSEASNWNPEQEGERRQENAAGQEPYIGMLALDLNYFKQINDTYGHKFGDEALIAVANHIKKEVLRDGDSTFDMAARYGGDEIIVVLPNMRDMQSLRGVAERLYAAITDNPIEVEMANDQGDVEKRAVTLEASIGAVLGTTEHAFEQIQTLCDECQYVAKSFKGTDRPTVATYEDLLRLQEESRQREEESAVRPAASDYDVLENMGG